MEIFNQKFGKFRRDLEGRTWSTRPTYGNPSKEELARTGRLRKEIFPFRWRGLGDDLSDLIPQSYEKKSLLWWLSEISRTTFHVCVFYYRNLLFLFTSERFTTIWELCIQIWAKMNERSKPKVTDQSGLWFCFCFFCCILSSAAFLKMRTVQNESFVSIRQKRERIQILQTNTSIHLDEFYIFESVVLLKIRTM